MIEVASSIVMGFLFLLSFSFLVFMHHTSANSQVTGCLSIIYFSTFENCVNLIFPKILVIYCFVFVFVPLFFFFFFFLFFFFLCMVRRMPKKWKNGRETKRLGSLELRNIPRTLKPK